MKSALNFLHDDFDKLPKNIQMDIGNRVINHLATGGNENDDYIKNQAKYAHDYIKKYGVAKHELQENL